MKGFYFFNGKDLLFHELIVQYLVCYLHFYKIDAALKIGYM